MIRVCYYKVVGLFMEKKSPYLTATHGLCPKHLKISLKEIKAEMEKYSCQKRKQRRVRIVYIGAAKMFYP